MGSPTQQMAFPLESRPQGSNFRARSGSVVSSSSASKSMSGPIREGRLRSLPSHLRGNAWPARPNSRPSQVAAPPSALGSKPLTHLTGRQCNIRSPWRGRRVGGWRRGRLLAECPRPTPPLSPARRCRAPLPQWRGTMLWRSHSTGGLEVTESKTTTPDANTSTYNLRWRRPYLTSGLDFP